MAGSTQAELTPVPYLPRGCSRCGDGLVLRLLFTPPLKPGQESPGLIERLRNYLEVFPRSNGATEPSWSDPNISGDIALNQG